MIAYQNVLIPYPIFFLDESLKSNAKNSFKGELFFALNGQIDYDDQLRRDSRIFMKFIIDHFIGSNKIRTREILKYLLK